MREGMREGKWETGDRALPVRLFWPSGALCRCRCRYPGALFDIVVKVLRWRI